MLRWWWCWIVRWIRAPKISHGARFGIIPGNSLNDFTIVSKTPRHGNVSISRCSLGRRRDDDPRKRGTERKDKANDWPSFFPIVTRLSRKCVWIIHARRAFSRARDIFISQPYLHVYRRVAELVKGTMMETKLLCWSLLAKIANRVICLQFYNRRYPLVSYIVTFSNNM